MGELGLTPRSRKVLNLAIDEAQDLGHAFIDTGHLLLGLMREGDGIAAGVLAKLGVKLDEARSEVAKILGDSSA
ncbi:MAG: Clp protease N-terminal domain-containing protein [Chloroflexota bacterium]